MRFGVVDDLAHGDGAKSDEVFNGSGDESSDSLSFASVMAEGEFVEVALEVFVADGAMMGAQPPAFEVGEGPVTNLHRVFLFAFAGGLYVGFVWPIGERFGVINV